MPAEPEPPAAPEPEPPAPPEPEPEPPAEAPEDDAVTEAAALMDRVMEAAIKEN